MTTAFDPSLKKIVTLAPQESWPPAKHRFDRTSVLAVRAALAARRPLLLRGEPGIGKSQLARAVATTLGVPFLSFVVDERTERDDLLYQYDAVSRLAEAQVAALSAKDDPKGWKAILAERNFIRPGVLWWAFAWAEAEKQAKTYRETLRRDCPSPQVPRGWDPLKPNLCGPVVLVDEIDKADPSVPNGLLECLGNVGFQTAQLGESVSLPKGALPPLVFITTNEERELPVAFLRRCLVLQMQFPANDAAAEVFLRDRARVSFPAREVSDKVIGKVVGMLLHDRRLALEGGKLSVPGAAEFLDLVRVLHELHPGDQPAQLSALEELHRFALQKNKEDE